MVSLHKQIFILFTFLKLSPNYIDLIVQKKDKLILNVSSSNFLAIVNLLLKSTHFRFVQLLDVLVQIIRGELIGLRLVICVIFVK